MWVFNWRYNVHTGMWVSKILSRNHTVHKAWVKPELYHVMLCGGKEIVRKWKRRKRDLCCYQLANLKDKFMVTICDDDSWRLKREKYRNISNIIDNTGLAFISEEKNWRAIFFLTHPLTFSQTQESCSFTDLYQFGLSTSFVSIKLICFRWVLQMMKWESWTD